MSTKLNRRHLFRLRPADVFHLFREGGSEEQDSKRYFRPPGAIEDEAAFLSACERCGKCSEACPYGVIEALGAVGGVAEGTPVLDPGSNPCRWCPNMDCIRACPSGALAFDANGAVRSIGKVALKMESCLTTEGILCDSCAVYCPPGVGAIRMVDRKPQLDLDRCVGCGLCAYHCESTPASLKVVQRQGG